MKKKRIVIFGFCVIVVISGLMKLSATPGQEAAVLSPDGRSLPHFLNSIDDSEHISRWRAGLDVTREFLSYCHGMSALDIIALFGRGEQPSTPPSKNGKFYYLFRFRSGDMSHLVSRLSHFPFYPDQLELWITVAVSAPNMTVTDAKIVDKTAYP